MRIGLVIDDLNRRRGGMSEWCWQFIGCAARRGYVMHVIAHGFGDEPLPAGVSRHKIAQSRSRVAFATEATRLIRELRLELVHDTGLGWEFDLFQPHGGSFVAWSERRLDMYPRWYRHLKHPIDALLPRQREFWRHWQTQLKALQDSPATILALSRAVADDFSRLPGIRSPRIEVVYNGVDCQRFSPAHRHVYRTGMRQQLGVTNDVLLLLIAAHNFRLKGVPELLRVAARLAGCGKPVHVVVAGGKRLGHWRRIAARLGIADRASFVGTVSDMVPYYAAADAYVHPTYYDPCCLVILEAAASGLPIITTRRHNGAAELFRDGAEILMIEDPAAEADLADHVVALFDERERARIGTAARSVALQHTFEQNVEEILRLYDCHAGNRAAA